MAATTNNLLQGQRSPQHEGIGNYRGQKLSPRKKSGNNNSSSRFVWIGTRVILGLLPLQMIGIFLAPMYLENYSDTSITEFQLLRWQMMPSLSDNLEGYDEVSREDVLEESLNVSATTSDSDILYDTSLLNRTRTPFLDDYRSRKHFPEDYRAPFLIVGGSDGSGTRAIVDTLIELGVFVFKEDKRTNDIHGSEMFNKGGWPPLVNLLLNETRSANYELSDLTAYAIAKAKEELSKLRRSIARKAAREAKRRHLKLNTTKGFLKERKWKREHPNATKTDDETAIREILMNNTHYATGSNIAWKAPVSMLLLPVLKEVFGPIRFLHCVRDGRDVALSDNQSPVKKFYKTYYSAPETTDVENKTNDKAMQLWNDWNLQVLQWAKEHSDGETFDYLTIRSEDLVNPQTRFETLVRLAHFVGSTKTVKDLCCMSQKAVKDLGKSAATFGDPKKKGIKREKYGPITKDRRHHRPRTREEILETKEEFLEMEQIDTPENKKALMLRERYLEAPRKHQEHLLRQQNKQDMSSRQLLQVPEDRHKNFGHFIEQKRQFHKQHHLGGNHHEAHRELPPNLDMSDTLVEDEKVPRRKENQGAPRRIIERVFDRLIDGPGGRDRRKGPAKEAPEKVMARYGKWQKLLENQTELSAKLHEFGADGLKTFGYEPQENFLDPPDESFIAQCHEILLNHAC